MLYSKHVVTTDCGTYTYIAERRPLISIAEVEELCEDDGLYQTASSEHKKDGAVIDIEELLCREVDVESKDITEDEFAYMLLGEGYQLTFAYRAFGDIPYAYINIYRKHKKAYPLYYSFEGICGQEPDVGSLGVVDEDHPSEEVFENARKDCYYQLRRYYKIPGISIENGMFSVMEVSEDHYKRLYLQQENLLG